MPQAYSVIGMGQQQYMDQHHAYMHKADRMAQPNQIISKIYYLYNYCLIDTLNR